MRTLSLPFAFVAFCIALLGAAFFLIGLPGGFVLDDIGSIVQNHILYINDFTLSNLIYAALNFHDGTGSRALPMLSFALDYWRAGAMDPATFKMTNILIHGLSVFFLIFLLRRLLLLARWSGSQATCGALLLAFIWAIHPLQVSSVLYVVQRMQTMANLFIILAFWAYLAMRQDQMAGGRGRWQGVLVILAWLMAMMCKEDAVLLPAYTLVLELTLLRFTAGQHIVARGLRQSYTVMTFLGVLLFVFYTLPRYWHWDAYPNRDFSSPERLLTQGRVLVMYLKQIVLPWPDWMPFNYDDYEVSRNLWLPWTTLPALLLLTALLGWAWSWRHKRPLFAFGVLFFFAGHFITSNIVGLELAFEHRNHLPMLGMILAVTDLVWMMIKHWSVSRPAILSGLALGMMFLGVATLVRAHTWGDPVRLGEAFVRLTPTSPRAWGELDSAWFDLYIKTRDKENLQHAITVCNNSFKHLASVTMAGNLVLYKSLLDTVEQADWDRLYKYLRQTPPGRARNNVIATLMKNTDKDFIKDKAGVVSALKIYQEIERPDFRKSVRLGVFTYKAGMQQDSMVFFRVAAQNVRDNGPRFKSLLEALKKEGHGQWAEELRAIHE